jgi:REP element-mobilizing transposase RayT
MSDIPPNRYWYSRGYLPHCDYPGLLQAITYRLADSLPAGALDRLSEELRLFPPVQREAKRRERIETWLDAGHGACVLLHPEAATCVIENWRHFAGVRYDLIAWVIMPNHVHILIRTYAGVALGRITQSWKNYTSRRIGSMIGIAPHEGSKRSETPGIWYHEYWDRYIRDERHFNTVVAYIHQNPVKAGLATCAEDWPWSSAHEFVTSDN